LKERLRKSEGDDGETHEKKRVAENPFEAEVVAVAKRRKRRTHSEEVEEEGRKKKKTEDPCGEERSR
jgi:hypothetical protein